MGEVMSSIAHHWRQPLNVIALQIQDALESYNEGEMTTEYFQETKKTIMNEVNFLTYTIDDFRNYFSKDQGNGEVHIKEVINHAISLIWAKADEGKTDIAFVGKDIIVQGRENEFKQVILNLLFNAIDSIKNKQQKETGLRGKIDIVAEEMNGSKQIMIRDNGIGINETIKGRIFEPYFTTKFQSRGTGNGLYMSKIIIEHNMNGELLARNVCDTRNQNCGAEFVIRFDNKA
jgi:signal transduction histidine kinase